MANLIYLDNSNFKLNARAVLQEEDQGNYQNYEVNYPALISHLSPEEQPIVAKVFVSRSKQRSSIDPEWMPGPESSWTSFVHRRNSANQEKMIDTHLTTEIILDSFEVADRENDRIVLVAGDSDYVPVVKALVSRGYKVAVAAPTRGLHPLLQAESTEFIDLTHAIRELLLSPSEYLTNAKADLVPTVPETNEDGNRDVETQSVLAALKKAKGTPPRGLLIQRRRSETRVKKLNKISRDGMKKAKRYKIAKRLLSIGDQDPYGEWSEYGII